MNINFAHIHDQGIDFAVFEADARTHTNDARKELLVDLTWRARRSGLKVDKAALAYRNGSRIEFFGTPDLVRYLAGRGVPRWNHALSA